MIEPSAKKLSAPMSIISGENAHTVEISARGPIFAPSSRAGREVERRVHGEEKDPGSSISPSESHLRR